MPAAFSLNLLSILKKFKLCCCRADRIDGVDVEMVTFPSLLNKQPADQWLYDQQFPYNVIVVLRCPNNMMVPPGVFVALQVALPAHTSTWTLSSNAIVCHSGDGQLCVKMVDDEQSLRFHARSIPQNRKAAFDVLITAIKQLAIACVGVPNLKFTVKYGCMRNGLVYNDADMLTASLPALIDARSKNQINVVADNRDAVPVVNFLGIPEESLMIRIVVELGKVKKVLIGNYCQS